MENTYEYILILHRRPFVTDMFFEKGTDNEIFVNPSLAQNGSGETLLVGETVHLDVHPVYTHRRRPAPVLCLLFIETGLALFRTGAAVLLRKRLAFLAPADCILLPTLHTYAL